MKEEIKFIPLSIIPRYALSDNLGWCYAFFEETKSMIVISQIIKYSIEHEKGVEVSTAELSFYIDGEVNVLVKMVYNIFVNEEDVLHIRDLINER